MLHDISYTRSSCDDDLFYTSETDSTLYVGGNNEYTDVSAIVDVLELEEVVTYYYPSTKIKIDPKQWLCYYNIPKCQLKRYREKGIGTKNFRRRHDKNRRIRS